MIPKWAKICAPRLDNIGSQSDPKYISKVALERGAHWFLKLPGKRCALVSKVIFETPNSPWYAGFKSDFWKGCALASKVTFERSAPRFQKWLLKSHYLRHHLHRHLHHRGKTCIIIIIIFWNIIWMSNFINVFIATANIFMNICIQIQWSFSPHNLVQHGESHDA